MIGHHNHYHPRLDHSEFSPLILSPIPNDLYPQHNNTICKYYNYLIILLRTDHVRSVPRRQSIHILKLSKPKTTNEKLTQSYLANANAIVQLQASNRHISAGGVVRATWLAIVVCGKLRGRRNGKNCLNDRGILSIVSVTTQYRTDCVVLLHQCLGAFICEQHN